MVKKLQGPSQFIWESMIVTRELLPWEKVNEYQAKRNNNRGTMKRSIENGVLQEITALRPRSHWWK